MNRMSIDVIPEKIVLLAQKGGSPIQWDVVLGPFVSDGEGGNLVGWREIAFREEFWKALGIAKGLEDANNFERVKPSDMEEIGKALVDSGAIKT
ncbi:MAG: hypothetical protein ACREHG_10300, partial [Candidatus Saccharimonadales bacterium]